MPILSTIPTPRLSQEKFSLLSYKVMEQCFAIHSEFGRFFEERVYKKELALRLPEIRLETPVDVVHRTFKKRYMVDGLTADGGLFEFKTVEAISPRHRAQLLNYLLLLNLGHGKLVNFRSRNVEHEFMNAGTTLEERKCFEVSREGFVSSSPGARALESVTIPLLEDLGTGLDLALYEEAVTHFLGGEQDVLRDVDVVNRAGVVLGTQRMRLCAPATAFKLTTFPQPFAGFATQCERLLSHTPLEMLHWVNISCETVTLTSIRKPIRRL